MKRSYVVIALVVVIVLVAVYAVNAIFTKSYEIPVVQVARGEMLISLNESGVVDARRAMTLTAPRIRGLQITWLAPEGSVVEEKDPVIRFDASEQQSELAEYESDLKIKRSALERAEKEYTIQEKQLKLDLEKARRNYDEKQYDAPRIADEAKMEYELAQLNFNAKLEQLKGDVEKAKVEVDRALDKVTLAKKELALMTINAPLPGLVVYLELWKGSSMSKVQEGDSPWPGQGLIKIPDLSEMIVKTTVSEVDAAKVDSGQEVLVSLDAIAGRTYKGVVYKKSTLARKKDPESKINVFDVDVAIVDSDDQLKPGMSAQSRIVVSRIPDAIHVPLEAVFEKEGRTLVYLDSKREREVTVGRRNNMSIEIVQGLEGGERLCLMDPTLDEAGLPGDKAEEPEINKRPQQRGTPNNGRPGRRGQ